MKYKNLLAVMCLLATPVLASGAHAQVTGDVCSDPIQVSGNVQVQLDMSTMTIPGAPDWMDKGCFTNNPSHDIDAYICWTSNVDGIVDIQTCNTAELDTQLALFDGCETKHSNERRQSKWVAR